MQFKKAQRQELARTWNSQSWFYQSLGAPAREIIERAYGLKLCAPRARSKAQEDVTLALSIFSREIGCDKAHAVHALLSGSIHHLLVALGKINGAGFTADHIKEAWEAAFRNINIG